MRLTCPDCAASYEVPDAQFGERARKVRCSACGSTWTQEPPAPAAAEPSRAPRPIPGLSEAADVLRELNRPQETPTAPDETAAPETAGAEAAKPPARFGQDSPPFAAAPGGGSAPEAAPEAEAEAEAAPEPERGGFVFARGRRGAEQETPPSPPLAADKPEEPAPSGPEQVPSFTKDLPDDRSFGASIKAAGGLGEFRDPDADSRRFTSGFLTAILILMVLLAVYLLRGKIAGAVPPAAPWLDLYAEQVDRGRVMAEDLFAQGKVWAIEAMDWAWRTFQQYRQG